MPALELSADDQQMLAIVLRNVREETETIVEPLRRELKLLAQRNSRPPGSALTPDAMMGQVRGAGLDVAAWPRSGEQ